MKKKLDFLLNSISKSNTMHKPILKKIDYDEYYSYLNTLPLNKIKENIAYYDGGENSFFTGMISSVFILIIFYISQQSLNTIKEIISEDLSLTNEQKIIIFKGYLSCIFILIIIAIVLFAFIYKRYRNRRYEMNIQKNFLKDIEEHIS